MDKDGDDVATKGELTVYFDKKFHDKDPHLRRLARRIFGGMDKDGDDIATKGELTVYFDKKFHDKDPHQFTRIILSKADKDGDAKLTSTEFLEWTGEASKDATDRHEKWNPLF